MELTGRFGAAVGSLLVRAGSLLVRAGSLLVRSCALLVASGSLLWGALVAESAAGQEAEAPAWVTVRQQVDVEMGAGDGGADVGIRFEFATQEPGAPLPLDVPVAFELLGFGNAVAHEVRLGRGGRVVLWPTLGSRRVAAVRLTEADVADGVATLLVSYRVDDVLEEPGAAVHARVPLLTGPPVRAATGGDAFQARISVPDEWVVTEGFPSGLRASGPGGYVVSLSVAPSIVGFRARTDGGWRPGFPLVVDLLTVLVLVTFAGFGWRHLRSMAK